MCAHPATVKTRRRVTSNGKSWFVTDCRECYRLFYRQRRTLHNAFRQLATRKWA